MQDFFKKNQVGSTEWEKGSKRWVSGAKIWPEKSGFWGRHVPIPPSNVMPPGLLMPSMCHMHYTFNTDNTPFFTCFFGQACVRLYVWLPPPQVFHKHFGAKTISYTVSLSIVKRDWKPLIRKKFYNAHYLLVLCWDTINYYFITHQMVKG